MAAAAAVLDGNSAAVLPGQEHSRSQASLSSACIPVLANTYPCSLASCIVQMGAGYLAQVPASNLVQNDAQAAGQDTSLAEIDVTASRAPRLSVVGKASLLCAADCYVAVRC